MSMKLAAINILVRCVIVFCSRAEVQTVLSNIPVLVGIGLGERGMRNYRLVKETCQVLLKLVAQKPSTNSPNPPLR
jgi:hypothetical protein